jgi:hypothetical protein
MEALGRCEMAFPKILYVILPFSVRNISFLLGPRASPPAPATLPLSNVSTIYPPMGAERSPVPVNAALQSQRVEIWFRSGPLYGFGLARRNLR